MVRCNNKFRNLKIEMILTISSIHQNLSSSYDSLPLLYLGQTEGFTLICTFTNRRISMLPCNFGQVTGTIVSDIAQRRPNTKSDKPFTITEFKIKVQGASDENPAIPFQAFNGLGDDIVKRYSQGDLVSLFYEPRNEVWETAEGEKRSALRLQVTQIPTTIRRGEKSKAKIAAGQQQELAV